MKVVQAFKYELEPNKEQELLFRKHAGCARVAYNWGLSLCERGYAKPNAMALRKILNSLKKTHYSWMYEVSKCAPQEALRDLERAYKNFFEGKAELPKLKGKDDAFRLTGAIRIVDERHIRLPRIGIVRTKEETNKFKGRVLAATVKREADRWFVSLRVEVEREIPQLNHSGIIGIDCNVDRLVTSEGEEFPLPKPLKKYLKILRRRSRQHSGKKPV